MKIYGLIGNTLDHSWSEDYFRKKFTAENITDSLYNNFPMEDLKGFKDFLRNNPEICGLNVTIPFKKEIIGYMDEIDPEAKEIQAVNCITILRKEDRLILKGYNTDKQAFKSSLIPLINDNHANALVLGTGGAAMAVVKALDELNIRTTFVSRTAQEGMLTYSQLNGEIIREHKLIINATPAGMWPDVKTSPSIPYSYLTKDHLLYDLVYNPELTVFLRKGREAGAQIKNGLEMLELQAELSWEKFKVQSAKCKVQSLSSKIKV